MENNHNLETIRHSNAHVLAYAVSRLFPGVKFGIGPAIEDGFYYDFDFSDSPNQFNEGSLTDIEAEMNKILKENLSFTKREVSRAEAFEMFKDQPYKLELINELPESEIISAYTVGDFTDLCRGPHVNSTSELPKNGFKLASIAGAYWRGSSDRPMMQRIYAYSFLNKDDLKAYLNFLEEAEKRDHRKLSNELDLFNITDEVGPGLILWHPNLALVREQIENYWRAEHRKRGYVIVNTPHIAKKQLWDISGHTEFYNDNMYYIDVEEEKDYVLKPMNCPFHMLIYKSRRHSYRNLPIRMAELGTVYRKEKSGTLHGLSRVRGFTQDDAHIFCTQDQFIDEIHNVIDLVDYTMKIFGLSYEVELSTRPEEFVGEIENWDKAEAGLKAALEQKGISYQLNEGDGAFYGPKIDFKLKDAIGRTWQAATVQLDFNLPTRFDLKYTEKDGSLQTPVMLHRVIFGSMERFVGSLIEHYSGAFPSWLAPVNCRILTVGESVNEYASKVANKMRQKDIRVEEDFRNESINKKIREGRLARPPYLIIIGNKEQEKGEITVRNRDSGQQTTLSYDTFIENLIKEINERSIKLAAVQ